jgi:5-hydroxyisourate hydrolase-like protein (transthyretin family)
MCALIALTQQTVTPRVPAQSPRDPTSSGTIKEGSAVIRGRVTDAETGQPLERMMVAVMSPDLQRIDRTWMRQAVTDAQGRYQIANLPASSYYVGASAGEFKVWYLGQQYGAPPNSMAYGQIGKKVELADGEVRQGIDFALTRALAITGRVTDEFGDPLANIAVTVERPGRRGTLG